MNSSLGNTNSTVGTGNSVPVASTSPTPGDNPVRPYVPDKSKQTASFKENAGVMLGGAGILAAILLLTLLRLAHPMNSAAKTALLPAKKTTQSAQTADSKVPITEEGPVDAHSGDQSQLNSDDIARTATKHPEQIAANLGAIQPFDSQHPWEPAAYQQDAQSPNSADAGDDTAEDKNERDAMNKASLVFVGNTQTTAIGRTHDDLAVDSGIGLPPGTKLRARIEAAVSTAVQTPVLAVVEYNYEKNGEIVIPAGAKAFGHLESADATGYVNVHFDSLLMPDGTSVAIEGSATDLRLRPVKGKVEGKHRGKNILVRSVAGLGEITATLAGRGSLDQSLSEGDLIRERAANNIAQASDQQLASMAVTQRIVVTVPANTEIYVVLGKPARVGEPTDTRTSSTRAASTSLNAEQLRQLLQLQKELNESATATTNQ